MDIHVVEVVEVDLRLTFQPRLIGNIIKERDEK